MYNYADDITLSYCHKILDILKSVLQQESIILLDWFGTNQMQANPYKFQAISVGKKTNVKMKNIQIEEVNIICEENVKAPWGRTGLQTQIWQPNYKNAQKRC